MSNTDLCLVQSPTDAVIHYDKICRLCLGTNNIFSIYSITYETLSFIDILEQLISIKVHKQDSLPRQICNSCITVLINCYLFKKQCLELEIIPVNEDTNCDELCRTCRGKSDVYPIFDVAYENLNFVSILKEFVSIQVHKDDDLPKQICNNCIVKLLNFYSFKKKCLQSQALLEEIINYNKFSITIHQNGFMQVPSVCQVILYPVTCTSNSENNEVSTISGDEHINLKLEETNESNKWNQRLIYKDNGNAMIKTEPEPELNDENMMAIESFEIKKEFSPYFEDNKDERNNKIEIQEDHEKDDRNDKIEKEEDCRKLDWKFACNVCEEKFISVTELIQHRTVSKHRKKKTNCDICGKFLDAHMNDHMRKHTSERPHKCTICLREFHVRSNLQRHMETHKGKKEKFLCEFCGKGYSHVMTLNEHKVTHSGTNPFKCNYCGKTFNHAVKFRYHIRIHKLRKGEISSVFNVSKLSEEERNELKTRTCDICHKIYSTKADLHAHKPIHGNRKFTCSECGDKFVSQQALNVHFRKHTGEKPYKCIVCTNSFKSKSQLDLHMKRHSGEKPYKCEICDKYFVSKVNLKVHIRIHTNEKPFVCDVCHRRFRDLGSLKKHGKRHLNQENLIANQIFLISSN